MKVITHAPPIETYAYVGFDWEVDTKTYSSVTGIAVIQTGGPISLHK